MILGALSFSNQSEPDVVVQRLESALKEACGPCEKAGKEDSPPETTLNPCRQTEVCFHPVTAKGFSGGFITHPRLPATPGDCLCTSPSGDILVLFSGNIYNPGELLTAYPNGTFPPSGERKPGSLANQHPQPIDQSPSGVSPIHSLWPDPTDNIPALIARAFGAEGPSFVSRLNGDFALFILLPNKKEAYLFRDHVGIRPLAWHYHHQTLAFSSDILSLSLAMEPEGPPTEDFLLGYFKYTDLQRGPTPGVKKLPPGHYLRLTESGPETIHYWHPESVKTDHSLTREKLLADLKALVSDAIAMRCDRRYTAGTHVSSGIDSAVVAALARPRYVHQESFHGFSWSPESCDASSLPFDEREIIRRLCQSLRIQPVFLPSDSGAFLETIRRFCNNQGYFNEAMVLQLAQQHGTNLLFSGWGGDEFISTGDRGIDSDLLFRGHWRLFFRRNPLFPLKSFLRNQLSYILLPALGILERGTARGFQEEARYLKKPFRKSHPKALRNFYFYASRRQLHLRLLSHGFLQERCESWAIDGFRHGVEYRYPLLDRRIIEYMLKVPSELLAQFPHFRPLLREIAPSNLTEEVRWHWEKTDPAAMALERELFREAALRLMEVAPAWKSNPALHCFDFDLLEKEIALCRHDPDHPRFRILARTLVYLRGIHECTLQMTGTECSHDD
jgi:asparagine synthase (glutamine-hydrolysing)